MTITHQKHKPVRKLTFAWTSDGSGDATEESVQINGTIIRVVHVPGTGGDQPTDNYDVVVNDSDGIDVLQGTGANISNAAASDFFPAVANNTYGWGTAVDSKLTIVVSNAGDTKSGSTILYYTAVE